MCFLNIIIEVFMHVCRCTACSVYQHCLEQPLFCFHFRILDCTLRFNVCQEPVALDILPVVLLSFPCQNQLIFLFLSQGNLRRSSISMIRSTATFSRQAHTLYVSYITDFLQCTNLISLSRVVLDLEVHCFLNIKGQQQRIRPVIIYIKCYVCISVLWQIDFQTLKFIHN